MKTAIKRPNRKLLTILGVSLIVSFLWRCSTDESPAADPVAFGDVSGTIMSADGNTYSNIRVELETNNGSVEPMPVGRIIWPEYLWEAIP